MKYESCERSLRELEVRLKLAKEYADGRDRELEAQRNFTVELEDKHERRLQQLVDSYEGKLALLDSENRRMGSEITRLATQLNCQ